MSKAEGINFWIVRKGEDPYEAAPEVAGAIADELLEPFDKKDCAFCSNKAPSAAVIAHRAGADLYTASICADCARMSDGQLAEKARAAEKRSMSSKRIRAAREELTRRGVLVDSGEKRLNPKTGKWEIVWKLNPELSKEELDALTQWGLKP
jgi:hypothetical protein